jgi:serine/threonine protein kinase
MGPEQIGPFRLLGRLGFGGMAEVFKAEFHAQQKWQGLPQGSLVALKRMLPTAAEDPACRSAFDRECRRAPLLNHERLAKTYGVFQHHRSPQYPTEPVLVLECLEGRRLVALYPKGQGFEPQSWEVLAAIGVQVSEALTYLHQFRESDSEATGLIHGDLSPKNLFVTRRGCLKVLDFGMALPIGCALGNAPSQVGGHGYMSPEYVRGEPLDCRSDFFSLGTVLYELATGERLFKAGTPAKTIDFILNRPIEPLGNVRADIPTPLARTIDNCLARNASNRPASAQVLRETFLNCLRDAPQDDSEQVLAVWLGQLLAGATPPELIDGSEGKPALGSEVHGARLTQTQTRDAPAYGGTQSSAERISSQSEPSMGDHSRPQSAPTETPSEQPISQLQACLVWFGMIVLFAFMLATTIWYVERMLD